MSLPKTEIENRQTVPFDALEFISEFEKLDLIQTYWAKITIKSTENADEYTGTIYADEGHTVALVADVKLFSYSLRSYAVNDFVKVNFKLTNKFAIIVERSPISWLKLTADWQANNPYVDGNLCSSAGNVSPQDASVNLRILLAGTPAFSIAYCPFKTGHVISFFPWPTEFTSVPYSGAYHGFCTGFPQLPIPTQLHQVLTCDTLSSDRIATIKWGYLQTHDRAAP